MSEAAGSPQYDQLIPNFRSYCTSVGGFLLPHSDVCTSATTSFGEQTQQQYELLKSAPIVYVIH